MSVKRKTLSKIILIVSILFVLAAIVYIDFVTIPKGSTNPYLQLFLSKEQKDSLNSIKRLNEEGTLYQMDYYADYTKPFYKLAMFLVRELGCTAFSTYTESGDVLMCRNYDCPWFDDEGNLTGLKYLSGLILKENTVQST